MCRFDTHPAKTSDWNCDDVNIGNLEKDIKQFCKDNFRLAPFFVMLYHALNIHPEKTLTENITEIKRTSDQSITIVFTSCRSASEFETDDPSIAELEWLSRQDKMSWEHILYSKFVESIVDIEEFAKMWLNHFLDTMKPTFMPEGYLEKHPLG